MKLKVKGKASSLIKKRLYFKQWLKTPQQKKNTCRKIRIEIPITRPLLVGGSSWDQQPWIGYH